MIKVNKYNLLLLLLSLLFATNLQAQTKGDLEFNPINTAVPVLSIAPDARGGSLGDLGAATTPDVASQYWNPAKYAFQYSKAGVSLSYTPWLRKLVNDVALAYLSGFYKIGDNDMQALGASLRYFTMGEIKESDGAGNEYATLNPYEMAFDISYSRKLSETFSMGVAMRYIRSDMGTDRQDESTPGNAFAADIAGYMEKYVILGNSECLWSWGFNISNIGTKISYDGGATTKFLPTNLKLGTALLFPFDNFNNMTISIDVNKYLVPTPPDNTGLTTEEAQKAEEDYNSTSAFSGIFKSFSDAPGGFSEELKEINLSLGAEYSYNDQFFVRGGYHYENPSKGNRQYFSVGAGFRMSVFQLDAAYLISTVQSNPLDQTLRFSLTFDMDGIRNLFR